MENKTKKNVIRESGAKKHDRRKQNSDANSLHCDPKELFLLLSSMSPASLAPPCDSLERNNMAKYRLAAAGDGEKSDTQLPDTPISLVHKCFPSSAT